MFGSERPEAVQAHHFTVVMYLLGDHAHRRKPASRQRSTAASVCPGRSRTPPLTARSGKICPGRVMEAGVLRGSARIRAVRARSVAEIPVLTPVAASQETV